jgi:hypothetical protein
MRPVSRFPFSLYKKSSSSGPAAVPFLVYVEGLWRPGGPYVRERALVANKPLSGYYVQMSR